MPDEFDRDVIGLGGEGTEIGAVGGKDGDLLVVTSEGGDTADRHLCHVPAAAPYVPAMLASAPQLATAMSAKTTATDKGAAAAAATGTASSMHIRLPLRLSGARPPGPPGRPLLLLAKAGTSSSVQYNAGKRSLLFASARRPTAKKNSSSSSSSTGDGDNDNDNDNDNDSTNNSRRYSTGNRNAQKESSNNAVSIASASSSGSRPVADRRPFRIPLLDPSRINLIRPPHLRHTLPPLPPRSSAAAPKQPESSSAGNSSVSQAPLGLLKPFKPPSFVRVAENAPRPLSLTHTNRVLGMRADMAPPPRALHDHTLEGAIILYEPEPMSACEQAKHAGKVPEVHVVVDPRLGDRLRPHQIDGVKFMYNCVTGKQVQDVYGCIMADEMGLGKTLQCITLLWTLLRQSPAPFKSTIDKAIIVCPSSLVPNWAAEITKWLGSHAIRPLVADSSKCSKEQATANIRQFVSACGRNIVNPVLIISYESLRIYAPELGRAPIGLMLCDEGHRLKNATSRTFIALNQLNAKRRIVISGTPIQNDLTEYFSLLNFACPGLLGTENEFRREYEQPILRGRDADASDEARHLSDSRLGKLVEVANSVIIRRTQDLLKKYLPSKMEHVVFCRLSDIQEQAYTKYLQRDDIKDILRGTNCQPLKAITHLRKICTHPALLSAENTEDTLKGKLATKGSFHVQESGKFELLQRMILEMRATQEGRKEKIVLISNYTQTLDLLEKLCAQHKWPFSRLDGQMPPAKRQQLVCKFNDPSSPEFVFLLSSKAGGCGINLVGANRLVLFDPDWNPASDMQALARVWRDGQRKTCYIYRFVATGTIEEKIIQRQCHKMSLSLSVVDDEDGCERHFSMSLLRQLFSYNKGTLSDTHDTFKCRRCVNGRQFMPPPSDGSVSERNATVDMSLWNHIGESELQKIPDAVLRKCSKGLVSFVFQTSQN